LPDGLKIIEFLFIILAFFGFVITTNFVYQSSSLRK